MLFLWTCYLSKNSKKKKKNVSWFSLKYYAKKLFNIDNYSKCFLRTISLLEWLLKDHVAPKTVMMLKT